MSLPVPGTHLLLLQPQMETKRGHPSCSSRCRALLAQPREVFGQGIRERSGCPILLAHRPVPGTAVHSPKVLGSFWCQPGAGGRVCSKPTQNHCGGVPPRTGDMMLSTLPLRPRAPRGALVPPACPAGTSAPQIWAVKVRGSTVPQATQPSRGALEAEVLPGSRGSTDREQPACPLTQRAQHGGGCRLRPLFVGQCHQDAVPGAGGQDPGGVSTGLGSRASCCLPVGTLPCQAGQLGPNFFFFFLFFFSGGCTGAGANTTCWG